MKKVIITTFNDFGKVNENSESEINDKQEEVNKFIIDTTLIVPIEKILTKLENGEFRDVDVDWLDKKLWDFMDFAAKTLDVKGLIPERDKDKPKIMNSYAVEYYIKYLTSLLSYFKKLNE